MMETRYRNRKIFLTGGYPQICLNYKRIYIHRDVWAQANGPIPTGHVIHHKDGDRGNYGLKNLDKMTLIEHYQHHDRYTRDENRNIIAGKCPGCKQTRQISYFRKSNERKKRYKTYCNLCRPIIITAPGSMTTRFTFNESGDIIGIHCPVCKEIKQVNHFYKSPKNIYGCYCKPCVPLKAKRALYKNYPKWYPQYKDI